MDAINVPGMPGATHRRTLVFLWALLADCDIKMGLEEKI